MIRFCFALAIILFALLPLESYAQSLPNSDIKKIERYLNNLQTAQADFLQIDPDGIKTTGMFFLNRPGKLRFEYDAPVNDFVVADGVFIYFYDAQVQEQSHAPIGQTLADFILRKDLKLDGDIRVIDSKRAAGLLQITLVQTADPSAGSLSLAFTEKPLMLAKWRVTDPQGAITEISLENMRTGIELANNLFIYRDPSRGILKLNE